MRRYITLAFLGASFVLASSCADDTVVQTASVEVRSNPNNLDDFQSAQFFSVVTSDIVPDEALPDPDENKLPHRDVQLGRHGRAVRPVTERLGTFAARATGRK